MRRPLELRQAVVCFTTVISIIEYPYVSRLVFLSFFHVCGFSRELPPVQCSAVS